MCAAVVATEAAVITTDPTMQLAETTFDTLTTGEDMFEDCTEEVQFRFESLQYSLFSNCGVEVVGGILFLITAIYIAKDKLACENSVSGKNSRQCKSVVS